MQVDPKNLTLWHLISDRLFQIPQYQRAYSWQTKQRQDLFDDLLAMVKKNHDYHFMATVVGLAVGQIQIGTDLYSRVDVVDGQQRLTTLILILKAIELALDENDKDRRSLRDTLVRGDDETLVLLHTNHDYSSYFINYIRKGVVPSNKRQSHSADMNIVKGIAETRAFVDSWEECSGTSLKALLGILKNKLFFIYHQLNDEKLVYTVFEVLNSRGLPVPWLDRAKSMMMGVVFDNAQNPKDVIDELHNTWARIYSTLGLRNIVSRDLLRYAATLWPSGMHSRIMSDQDALELFRGLAIDQYQRTITISQHILSVAEKMVALHDNVHASAVNRIAQARMLHIAISGAFKGQEKAKLLDQWERITFRIYCLHDQDSRTKVGAYVRLACGVRSGVKSASEVMAALISIGEGYPIENVEKCLAETNCYENWEESLRYLLYEYEKSLAENYKPEKNILWQEVWRESASDTIEHIYPQLPKIGSQWNKDIDERSEKRQKIKNYLGNLAILPKSLNSQASNKEFSEKSDYYLKSGFRHLNEIVYPSGDRRRRSWKKEDIEAREKKIINWAKDRWSDVS
ncbi:MAG: DUF262 domain-containing HNH endonuclease family protein [Pseudomonadota bacterium]|nr:DUF262 domain-containing HNH endonuclease family protein [Pseudomonadota bacterium]